MRAFCRLLFIGKFNFVTLRVLICCIFKIFSLIYNVTTLEEANEESKRME